MDNPSYVSTSNSRSENQIASATVQHPTKTVTGSWVNMFNPSLNLIENGLETKVPKNKLIDRIVSTYPPAIKFYTIVRFKIINLRFLLEIEQHLPDEGKILDIGCGFGLFALYMAACKPNVQVIGLDINRRRLQIAESSAAKLGLTNVSFRFGDLREWKPTERIDGAYALDVFHHIPVESGNSLLTTLCSHLRPGGKFILKDIDTHPRAMMFFTYLLDLLMSPRDSFYYRSATVWQKQLESIGFEKPFLHYLWDVLPYPHILLVATKPNID